MMEKGITWKDFAKAEIRIGTITEVEFFEEARVPAFKLKIDFGEYGTRRTSAQITTLYTEDKLIGMQVTAVVNIPPKQIAGFMSECLILGAVGDNNEVTLIHPEREVRNGLRIG